MAARNRVVSAVGAAGAGPTSGANQQPVAVFYSIVELSGDICDNIYEFPNEPFSLTLINYV